MDNVTQNTARKPDVPVEVQNGWQRIVDLLAMILSVPAALIMRVDFPQIEVFLSSATAKNPLQKGKRVDLSGFYCESVIKQRSPLLVLDALKDPEWEHGMGFKLGMTFYLGYPLIWPDGEIFGTICVLDEKDNSRVTQFRDLLFEFQQMIERDLCLIFEEEHVREDLLTELKQQGDHLREKVIELTTELEKSKQLLQERERLDDLVSSDLSFFSFTSHYSSTDQLYESMSSMLNKTCLFLKADHYRFMEILPNRKQVRVVMPRHQESGSQENLDILISSSHPWAFYQLVGQGKPVVFSSLEVLPLEANADRVSWEQSGIQAAFFLPLSVEGEHATHLLVFLRYHNGADWPLVHTPRLRLFGALLANMLIHQNSREALLKSELMLAKAQRIAHLGSWEWDIVRGDFNSSVEVYRICGLLPQKTVLTDERFLSTVHPDDRWAVRRALKEALSDPLKPLAIEHRVVRPDGTERRVYVKGEIVFDQERRPVQMIGTIHDITERKREEEALEKTRRLKEQLEAENIYLRKEIDFNHGFSEIIGVSDPIKFLIKQIQQVAPTRTTVLLTGETGTGKGLFASAIHKTSDRRDKPFVNVNCAGLPSTLIESELFGREKGAFTGSVARQIGRFELANGGTIFLDEIGETSLEVQAKLLKVIEDGEFERLGSPLEVKVDVRIIASTNRDLGIEVGKDRFRKDLFYRLNVLPINIPPLRERREDISLLTKFYADKFKKIYNKRFKNISKSTLSALENYDWPGNVRELINVIERAVILSEGPELQIIEKIKAVSFLDEEKTPKAKEKAEIKDIVQEIEREHFLKALQEVGWRIEGHKGAAQLLGLKPNTMRARMKKLGIMRPGIR
jgi:formate hydrogenlyase transcriptional activator